ncbi:hypothetical protein [Fusobacterium mortiferum]|uniref:Uncharacterized protein n=1 Tax=Fusobacterium mortiferum TaxID=850 RepID=A0ABS2G502_FUSMR|nr:hypothetical protein [Fusobacterium mortiferum]MBM6876187.1 hypothetical protein [Fusobacterium mortiferum]
MKYKIYLYVTLKIIKVSIDIHLEIIENLGLKIKTKEKQELKEALEIAEKLYEANKIDDDTVNKYAKKIESEIIVYHYMRKKNKKEVKTYNYEKMDNLLPDNFLDSFHSIYLPALYIKDKLLLTIKKENIEKEFNIMLEKIDKHCKYIEDNYLDKFYEEAKVE